MSFPDAREAALRQFVTGALRDADYSVTPASAGINGGITGF